LTYRERRQGAREGDSEAACRAWEKATKCKKDAINRGNELKEFLENKGLNSF
jgi:uncharacterized ferritin-like protein (DUF455 family)